MTGRPADAPIVTPPLRHRAATWLLTRPVARSYDVGRARDSRFVWRVVPPEERGGGTLELYELRVLGVINGVLAEVGHWISDRHIEIGGDGRVWLVYR